MEVFALTTMTPFAEPQWSWEDWQALGSLNSGVLFINKSLEMTVYNGLAAQLLNVVVPIGQAVPLQQCLAPEREEYQVLSAIVTFEREFRNHVLTWAGDGSIRHVLMDSFKKENSAGSVDGMYVVMKDLGNFTVLEQHMQKTDKLATLGKIAAGIAHEIRNPMTTIKGFLQVMETRFACQNMNEELQYTQVMLQEIDRVNALVSELLLLSRPHHVEKTVCSMETILAELYPLIESQTLLRSINFECTTGKLPSIVADSNMLKQVLLNLVKNALEAMDDGGTLKISATADGAWVRVDVSDTGPGIPYYLMDRILTRSTPPKTKERGWDCPFANALWQTTAVKFGSLPKDLEPRFSVLLPYDKEADHTPS